MKNQKQLLLWQEQLEEARAEYLATARAVARKLLSVRDTITVNDVRAIAPPPAGIDGRVMGVLFKSKEFEATGDFIRSTRGECHGRPIQKFRLAA
jgi:hypothetical protein